MEHPQIKCSGDCLKCNPIQRQYCAAQFTYNTMRRVEDLFAEFTKIEGQIEAVNARIETIQGNESAVFDPTQTSPAADEEPLPTDD